MTLIETPAYKLARGKRLELGLKLAAFVALTLVPLIPWLIWRPNLTLGVVGLIVAFSLLVTVVRKAEATDWLGQLQTGIVRTQCELQEPANLAYRHALRDSGASGARA